ncbi:MAG: glycosyltransferase family 2 protein [Clostridiales bacterium]|jgi:GT2 family glycosyltransferase|nr:glycosyltransferase family 2 protein [Clostridiales bacterium]
MDTYTVTGCIVTHNNESTIEKTVGSLLSFTNGTNFKLFIVDNLSEDGTLPLIKEKFGGFDNLEIIESDSNMGFGAGHNSVMPRLDSKYHLVINPDITIADDVITKMAEYLDKNEDIGLLSPRIRFPDGRDQVLGKRDPKLRYLIASRLRNDSKPGVLLREYAMLDKDMSRPFDIENATGCFMMVRTEIFKKLNGFDDRYFMYFEDSDFTRTLRNASRAVYYPDAVVYHVWGRESKKNIRLMAVQIKSMLYYFWKWKFK